MCVRFDICVNNGVRMNRLLINILLLDFSVEYGGFINKEIFCSLKFS